MHQLLKYKTYIFDCDGVILDSNVLKVEAIRTVLTELVSANETVNKCVSYFKNNFGKSRFHHADYFVKELIDLESGDEASFKNRLLDDYSKMCKDLYLDAQVTPGFEEFVLSLSGVKYVASGSEQEELRDVFRKRGLSKFFKNIFGSPMPKAKIIENILSFEKTAGAVMIGDSQADYLAAKQNEVDFFGYLKYSNVEQSMRQLASEENFSLIESWSECQ